MPEFLFELVGPAYALSRAEIFSVLGAMGGDTQLIAEPTGLLLLETEHSPERVGERLGLTHRILEHLESPPREEISSEKIGLDIPPGSAAVRTRRIEGKGTDIDTEGIRENLGDGLKEKHPIELSDPDNTVLVLISDRCHIGLISYDIDKEGFKEREVENRDFFSPISLEPRYARALINLARPKKGDRMHDPFCGTGGIMIEAHDMGLEVTGGDLDPKMVKGTERNMEQYSADGDITVGDVKENTPDDLDCMVTDPPYGRSASTSGEELENIYRRLFETAGEKLKEGGRLSAIFPEEEYCHMGEEYLELEGIYPVRIHGSLVRHFCVFKKDFTES